MTPSIGRIVHYSLTGSEAATINRRREMANANMPELMMGGPQVHLGNSVTEGDVFPMVIVRVWPMGSVNGQVLLDGTDNYWAGSKDEGEGPGTWQWPPRVD